jgi:hypothetical protein
MRSSGTWSGKEQQDINNSASEDSGEARGDRSEGLQEQDYWTLVMSDEIL